MSEVERSSNWALARPTISAVIATYNRSTFLPGLFEALEAQDLPIGEFEVVLVDNGSTDDTAAVLGALLAASSLAMSVVRVAENHGPAPGRNLGARIARADLIAITDDDCLPTPSWLRITREAFATGADVVQGSVRADPAGVAVMGPWDHTIQVSPPTPFFETCNVAYRRDAFERAGGFDEDDPLLHPPTGRAFGEDACLAWEVQRTGGAAAFAAESLVHHRCIPSTYRRWLADQRQLERFPGLARRSPLVARWLHRGIFLDRRTMWFDVALVALVIALPARRPWVAVAALPWLRIRWGDSLHAARGHRRTALGVLPRLAWSDLVGLAAMVRGSVRYRRLIL